MPLPSLTHLPHTLPHVVQVRSPSGVWSSHNLLISVRFDQGSQQAKSVLGFSYSQVAVIGANATVCGGLGVWGEHVTTCYYL